MWIRLSVHYFGNEKFGFPEKQDFPSIKTKVFCTMSIQTSPPVCPVCAGRSELSRSRGYLLGLQPWERIKIESLLIWCYCDIHWTVTWTAFFLKVVLFRMYNITFFYVDTYLWLAGIADTHISLLWAKEDRNLYKVGWKSCWQNKQLVGI